MEENPFYYADDVNYHSWLLYNTIRSDEQLKLFKLMITVDKIYDIYLMLMDNKSRKWKKTKKYRNEIYIKFEAALEEDQIEHFKNYKVFLKAYRLIWEKWLLTD